VWPGLEVGLSIRPQGQAAITPASETNASTRFRLQKPLCIFRASRENGHAAPAWTVLQLLHSWPGFYSVAIADRTSDAGRAQPVPLPLEHRLSFGEREGCISQHKMADHLRRVDDLLFFFRANIFSIRETLFP